MNALETYAFVLARSVPFIFIVMRTSVSVYIKLGGFHVALKRPAARIYLGLLALLIAWLTWKSLSTTDVNFESSDGGWADGEVIFKGRDFAIVQATFESYKARCSKPNATLLRTTEESPYNIFQWWSYAHEPKWKVPYRAAKLSSGYYSPPCANVQRPAP